MQTGSLDQFETPALILDQARMDRNIKRMQTRLADLGVTFRPRVKTSKCMDVARRFTPNPDGPIAVSTLHEAEYFAADGVNDILYTLCIAPNKLQNILDLLRKGIKLSLILDSMETARPGVWIGLRR